MTTKINTPSVLAFERNFDISDAFLSQKDSQQPNKKETPISIIEKSVRGTISNRLTEIKKANDPTKLDAEIQNANLQKVDAASLNEENDTLVAKWSCKVLPFTGEPNVCNDQDYQAKLVATVQEYLKENSVSELTKRYALNIANARWLWRNRVGAEEIKVTVSCKIKDQVEQLTFDAKSLSLKHFDNANDDITKLASWIEQGLLGQEFIIIYVEAEALVGYGQEVYPSQELVLDKGNTKGKILYAVNGKAGIHSQKVGNAIRTIDTWYPDYVEREFPIAIEPYGAVTTLGKAFRQPKAKMDFYTLFDDWITKDKKPEVEQQHYVIAILLRGGVFGKSSKKNKK